MSRIVSDRHVEVDCKGTIFQAVSPALLKLEQPVTVALRYERLKVSREPMSGGLRAVVVERTYLGQAVRLEMLVDNGPGLTADVQDIPAAAAFAKGDRVSLAFDPQRRWPCQNRNPPRKENNMAGAEDAFAILRSMSAATIWEAAGKRGDMSPRIKPLFTEARVAGPAFTVKMFPGETLAAVRAVDAAPPGSVIVIDAGAAERGVSMVAPRHCRPAARGSRGLVTNGTVRDLAEILERKFPVFADRHRVRGRSAGHPGWLDIPISIGECGPSRRLHRGRS